MGASKPLISLVTGVGVTRRFELAVATGLKVDDGSVVGDHLRRSVPGVYAARRRRLRWHPDYGCYVRVGHWANALNQGVTAEINAAGGDERDRRLPYFFSDQCASAWSSSATATPMTRSCTAAA